MTDSISKLESEREALLKSLATTGDMRRGTITEVYRSCGKPTCACANSENRGHGPYYAFTKKIQGKTKTLQLRAGPALKKLEHEVETYQTFRKNCDQLIAVNESLCDARIVGASEEVKKKEQSSVRLSKRRSSPR